MAKLVTKQQRLVLGVMNPQSGYSRVITCLAAPQGLAAIDYGYTIAVGQKVRLISVRLFFYPTVPDTAKQVGFKVLTGTTVPATQEAIRQWESVLPITWRGTGLDQWYRYHGRDEYEWTMNRLYIGEGRRFGIWAQCNWDGVEEVHASFEIMEG
ncbi:hypothetical protein ES707_04863 [subsurface metagenome]